MFINGIVLALFDIASVYDAVYIDPQMINDYSLIKKMCNYAAHAETGADIRFDDAFLARLKRHRSILQSCPECNYVCPQLNETLSSKYVVYMLEDAINVVEGIASGRTQLKPKRGSPEVCAEE